MMNHDNNNKSNTTSKTKATARIMAKTNNNNRSVKIYVKRKSKKRLIGGATTQHIKPKDNLSILSSPEEKSEWDRMVEDTVNQGPGFPPDPPLNECIIL